MTWKRTVADETGKADKTRKEVRALAQNSVGDALLKPCAPERSNRN
jgi:hypothetical protein